MRYLTNIPAFYEFSAGRNLILRFQFISEAPKLFQLAWTVVEPLLTGRVMSKVAIYGTNKESWKPLLLEHIDPDNLPSACGGAMTSCLPVIDSMRIHTILSSLCYYLLKFEFFQRSTKLVMVWLSFPSTKFFQKTYCKGSQFKQGRSTRLDFI